MKPTPKKPMEPLTPLRPLLRLFLLLCVLLCIGHTTHAQGIELACPQGTSILNPGGQTYDSSTGKFRQWLCVDSNGTVYLATKNINGWYYASQYPGPTVTNKIDQCLASFTVGVCIIDTSLGAGNSTNPPTATQTILDFRSGSPFTFRTSGAYSNTAADVNLQLILGNIDPIGEFQRQYAGNFFSDALTIAHLIPPTSTQFQADAVDAMLVNASNNATNGVAYLAISRAAANGASIWAINPLLSDTACTGLTATESGNTVTAISATPCYVYAGANMLTSGFSVGGYNLNPITIATVSADFKTITYNDVNGSLGAATGGVIGMTGATEFNEFDYNVLNAGTAVSGPNLNGAWTQIPSVANGWTVNKPVGAADTKFWAYGFGCAIGATSAGGSGCVNMQPIATGTNQQSQSINFVSADPVSGTHVAYNFLDTNGNWAVNLPSRVFFFKTNGDTITPGGGISGGAAPTVTGTGTCSTSSTPVGGMAAGSITCTAVSGAATITFTFANTAPNFWKCEAYDATTFADTLVHGTHTNATCVFSAAALLQNDVIVFSAVEY